MSKISFKYNRGMTYLEVVLAVAIISFVVMAFARMFLVHNVAVTSSRMHTLAGNWAADKMEEIKSNYYVALATGTWEGESEVLGGTREFSRNVRIEEIDEGLKEVEVVVSWEEVGDPRSLRIVSFMADY